MELSKGALSVLFCFVCILMIFYWDYLPRESVAIGLNYVGALAYADDIVLLAPTPSAMRIYTSSDLWLLCGGVYDINFNPDKYKFLVIPATKRRHLYNAMCKCCFFVGNKMIDNVDPFSHVGLSHILTSPLLDGNDIVQWRNTFLAKPTTFCAFLINLRL